jgi:hypothetical protein
MSDLKDLIDLCKAQALRDALLPNEDSIYRTICRAYSARFHTPLIEVYALDPEHVMREEFSAQVDDIDIDDQLDSIRTQICMLEDPEYEAKQEGELLDWMEDIEMAEEERIQQGKSIFAFDNPTKMKAKAEKPKVEKTPTPPSSGSANLAGINEKNEK